MPIVFISYRREDTSPYAGRLSDRRRTRFGKEVVFMDIDTIQPGDDFVDVITNVVGSCDVVIAVIGKGWIAAADDRGGRGTGRREAGLIMTSPQGFRSNFSPIREVGCTACFRVCDTRCGTYVI